MTDDVDYWLALSLTPGVGSVLVKRLLDRFESPEAVFQASLRELLEVEGLAERVAREITKGPLEKRVKRELYLLDKVKGKVLTLRDDQYPRRLKAIYDPPAVLYLKGEIRPDDGLAVAIVGSRKTSPYGRMMTEKISQDLAHEGVTVVSGMARGIDSVAHGGALSAGGRTLAVLGSGIDVIYPRENRSLFTRITEQGAVLSEFPMGSPPEAGHFPKRNRIISGLSMGVVVIQAGPESGSLITADCALEQGREVFAVPGNIGAEGSRGTHRLIKDGAKLVESSRDILEEILPQWRNETTQARDREVPRPSLPEEERKLYEFLEEEPAHIDAIIRETRMDPGRVSSLLLNLELKGLVAQWPGKCFSKRK